MARSDEGPRVLWRFFVGSRNTTEALRAAAFLERRRHGDLVVLDADDHYRNLVNKVSASMRWKQGRS